MGIHGAICAGRQGAGSAVGGGGRVGLAGWTRVRMLPQRVPRRVLPGNPCDMSFV